MCGIAGIIHFNTINLNKMLDALKHRGPDDKAIYTHDQVALLHTRLSIQDVQYGKQPFHQDDYTIIFNGEIYNHLKLRQQLQEFNFKTKSDTETLLYLFIKYNYKLFDLIDGMYAFCIYDKKNGKLILARDRAGKKPLYYYSDQNNFIFASELNALKSVIKLDISRASINCYLRAGFIWKPYTAYENVFEISAGSYLIVDINNLQQKAICYFNLLDCYHKKNQRVNFYEGVLQVEEKLKASVADRINASDVEVGVFLSGGIDSNLIAAMAAQVKADIKTFTVKFSGLYDEAPLARLAAEKYKTNHTELKISSNLKQDIEHILLSYGEPFMDSSAIPTYYIAREASKFVKVILSGDGADELFAGYRRYVPLAYRFNRLFGLISSFLKWLPKPKHKQSLYNYFYRLVAMSNKKGLDLYLSSTTDIFEDSFTIADNDVTKNLNQFITNIFHNHLLSNLDKALYLDFSILLFCDLLIKMDIASMAHSLEVRSPFLSKELMEFAPQLPPNFKINRFRTKYILRELAKKYLPIDLINQPKRGFEVPIIKWVNNDLREIIHDHLTSNPYCVQYIDQSYIKQLIEKKIDVAPEKRAKMLWTLFCLEIWYRNEYRFKS